MWKNGKRYDDIAEYFHNTDKETQLIDRNLFDYQNKEKDFLSYVNHLRNLNMGLSFKKYGKIINDYIENVEADEFMFFVDDEDLLDEEIYTKEDLARFIEDVNNIASISKDHEEIVRETIMTNFNEDGTLNYRDLKNNSNIITIYGDFARLFNYFTDESKEAYERSFNCDLEALPYKHEKEEYKKINELTLEME